MTFFHFVYNWTDITSEKEEDIPKETGYLGDIDTSSSESLEAQSSDSDDDIAGTSRKGDQWNPVSNSSKVQR